MKKSYFEPKNLRFVQRLPMLQTRRMPGLSHPSTTSYRSHGGENPDNDPDGVEAKRVELFNKIDARINAALATRATKEELDQIKADQSEAFKGISLEALREIADDKNGVMAMLSQQGLEIKRLKDSAANQPKDMSIRAQCAEYVSKNKDVILKIRNGIKAELPAFELETRALASPMLPSTVMPDGTAYINRFEIQPGLISDLRDTPNFWNLIKKGSTNSETYRWTNKKVTEGAAGFIGPGVYKPAVSFTVESEVSNAKKIAVNEKMATELFEDIDGFANWVETELKYMLDIKLNETLQGNGAGSSTVPRGLQNMSVAYNALTGFETADPNFWDCIKAGVVQLRITKFKGPIIAIVNPVDLANGVHAKATTQGQLFIPPALGCTIVEDDNMTLGSIQFLAVDYYKTLIYKAFTMKYGFENDDFTKNLVTVIGEMRLHNFFSENHTGFAIYDTIAAITAAITPA